MVFSVAQAATFGHSRIISALGQPLHVEIPVTQLTQQEIESLRAVPAPAVAWQEAGMTPPVPLDSMRLVLLDGYRPGVKVIQLRSDQAFDQTIVDVLLDIRSASGQQRYQVSLLAHADQTAVQRAGGESARSPRIIDGRADAAASGSHASEGTQIHVRQGDNMFAIAQRHAVQGVTVYQMMIALQRANRQAFIEDNVNLVKAGAALTMPDHDTLTALSDREARRIFLQHVQAFERYRQRSSGSDIASIATSDAATAQGPVTDSTPPVVESETPQPATGTGDVLRLSGGQGVNGTAQAQAAEGAQGGTASINGEVLNGLVAEAQQNEKARGNSEAPVSLLASSGAITSDAAPENKAGTVSGKNTGQGSESTPAHASTAATPVDADDQAAASKGVVESRKRVLELEDNVRHLNEALQKQGHVAAEAALEGARSVSEAIKEVISLIEDPEDTAAGDTVTGDTAAGATATGAASGDGAADQAGNGGQPGVAPVTPESGSLGVSGSPIIPPQTGADADSREAPADAQQPSVTAAAGSTSSAAVQAGAATSPPAAAPRVEREKSWLQRNPLSLIGGGLLLILLVVVWLLRRGSTAKRDIFDSDSPITDSMVREKLSGIDLDLDAPPAGESGRR